MIELGHQKLRCWIWGSRHLSASRVEESNLPNYEPYLQTLSLQQTHIPFFIIHDLCSLLEAGGALLLRELPPYPRELKNLALTYRALLGRLSTSASFQQALLLIETSDYKFELREWLFHELLSLLGEHWPRRQHIALSELSLINGILSQLSDPTEALNNLTDMFPHFENDFACFNSAALEKSTLGVDQITIIELWPLLKEEVDQLFLRQLMSCYEAIPMLSLAGLKPAEEAQEVESLFNTANTHHAGGLEGLSNRGPLESLLPTELVYLEEQISEGVDLFDLRAMEAQQLYFVRDDSILLRKRRHVVIALELGERFYFQAKSNQYSYGTLTLALIWSCMAALKQLCSADMLRLTIVTILDPKDGYPYQKELDILMLQLARLFPPDRLLLTTRPRNSVVLSELFFPGHKPYLLSFYEQSCSTPQGGAPQRVELRIPIGNDEGIGPAEAPDLLAQKCRLWVSELLCCPLR